MHTHLANIEGVTGVMTGQTTFLHTTASCVRKLIVLPVLALALVVGVADAARAESSAAYMQRVQNELLAAQRSGSVSAFSNVFRKHMAVSSIGLTALGPHASALPKPERPAFYNGMINFIAKYSAKEAPKYPVASAVVVGQSQETAGGATVDSRITLRSGESYDVRWKLIRDGQSFKVRDAQVIGFWMSSFLDNLFQTYISENGNNPRALVMALNR